MRSDQDDLLGLLAAAKLRDDVGARTVGLGVRLHEEPHTDLAGRGEPPDQHRVLDRDGRRRDLRNAILVLQGAGVGGAQRRRRDRADERRRGAELRRFRGALAAELHRFAVVVHLVARADERVVEENDLPFDLLPAESL